MKTDDTQAKTVAERIRSSFDRLTRAERQLANAMLENYPVSGLGSITAIAESSGVSTPTVTRMAKKLGFTGFQQLQGAFRHELEATLSNPITKHELWAENAPKAHILNRFSEAVMQNMRKSLAQINPDEFDAACALLSDPGRSVYLVGGRITRTLADYFFTHLQVIRENVSLVASNSNAWPHYALNMKSGDVLVVFDIRRYEYDIIKLAEMACARGVEIILLTDQWMSPVAKHAACKFNMRIEVPSAWDTSIVIMIVVEAMISAVQSSNWSTSRGRIRELEELFDASRLFRKFV